MIGLAPLTLLVTTMIWRPRNSSSRGVPWQMVFQGSWAFSSTPQSTPSKVMTIQWQSRNVTKGWIYWLGQKVCAEFNELCNSACVPCWLSWRASATRRKASCKKLKLHVLPRVWYLNLQTPGTLRSCISFREYDDMTQLYIYIVWSDSANSITHDPIHKENIGKCPNSINQ